MVYGMGQGKAATGAGVGWVRPRMGRTGGADACHITFLPGLTCQCGQCGLTQLRSRFVAIISAKL